MELRDQALAVASVGNAAEPRLTVTLACSSADVEDAQRLRYKVFAEELGAQVGDRVTGLDADEFDPHCDHLIVRDQDTLRVVGTYRILTPHAARALGRLYCASEFDLTRLANVAPTLLEVGRACVHRAYRSGATILMLWSGLARYMNAGGYRHLIGCASVSLADGGHAASRIRIDLQRWLTDAEYRAFPKLPFPYDRIEPAASCEIPPLIRGYLRVGARVCGDPAWDPDFNTADFLVWLSLDSVGARYARHFDLLANNPICTLPLAA